MAATEKKPTNSLYVGDLHPDVSEEDLTETFSRVAPLLSVHLCRHKPSGRSLCYAYVNFWLPCHALTALKCLNHTLLKGKPIRVMWNERDSIARKYKNGNLFVKNLDKSITSPLLQEVFSKYGTIISCKVAHENGNSKGFGFVQFDSEDSAVAARTALHDALLAGKKLYVSKFLRKNERNGAEGCFRSLYVKNIDEDITADVLKAKFSACGTVTNAVIVRDEKGRSKGFGFVNFDSHEAAKRAKEFLNGEKLGLKSIVVDRAMKKSELRRKFRQMSGYTSIDHSKESKDSLICVNNLNRPVCGKEFIGDYGAVNSAMPMWNYKTMYTSLSCPYDTNKALKSLTGPQLEGQEVSKLHKPFEKFPTPSFYADKYQQSGCNFTYFSCPAPLKQSSTLLHSTVYQYFASSPFNSSYPVIPHNLHGTFDAFPKKIAALTGYVHEGCLEMPKAQKLLSPLKLGCNGDVKAVSTNKTLDFPKQIALNGNMQEGYLEMPKAKNLSSQMKLGSNDYGKELSTNRTLLVRTMIGPGCTPQKPGSASLKVSTNMTANAH